MLLFKISSIILLFSYAKALYEDQAGMFDWRQQYIGRVSNVHFESSGQSGKRITVATDKNVIASLNIKNGEIGWRQIFEKGDAGRISNVLQVGNNLVTISSNGEFVRSFSPTVGNLQWEVTGAAEDNQGTQLAVISSSEDSIGVLSGGKVCAKRLDNGQDIWSVDLPNSNTVSYRFLHSDEGSVFAVGVHAGSHVSVIVMDEDGKQTNQASVPAAWVSSKTQCIFAAGHYLICVDTRTSILYSLSLLDCKSFLTSTMQDLKLSGNEPSLFTFQPFNQDDIVTQFGFRLGPSHVVILSVAGKGQLEVVRDLPGVNAVQIVKLGDSTHTLEVTRNKDVLELSGYDLDNKVPNNDLIGSGHSSEHHGLPTEVYGLIYRKKDGSSGVRLLLLSEDHSITLLQQSGKVSWTREEALSSILSVEMVDLPVSHLQAQMEDEFGSNKDDIAAMFLRRFTSQFSQLKEFLLHLRHRLKLPRQHHSMDEEADEDGEDEDDEEYLTRDAFNLHKMIVAVTSPGKIFGIDGPTGRLMWQVFLRDLAPFDGETLALFIQRTTAHFPNLPQCIVLGKHRISGNGKMYTFNPITGAPVDGMPTTGMDLDYKILQVTMGSHMEDNFFRPLIIMDTNFEIHNYPASSDKLVQELAPSLYMFNVDVRNGNIEGFGIRKVDNKLKAQSLWKVDLQHDSQKITKVITKRAAEHVHSQGIVMADRSVLYKYLNPNIVVITTEGVDAQQKSFFNIYLIDIVSGHIVFHCNHKKAGGPLEVVVSENWVVYSYWNQKHRRNEIAVLELYEGRKQSNATAFSSLHPPPPPLTMRQAYIFNGHISKMAVTITEKGITNKHIMMALESGGILEMPKAFLDPRRPIVPTAEMKEEGIMPYVPELPRPYEATVNYNLSVYNVQAIHTSPAGLESHSLVLCYGLDLFYTRVMPSKMFDVLKEDFDYFFIGSVLVGMIAVSVVSQKLAGRKALNRAWR